MRIEVEFLREHTEGEFPPSPISRPENDSPPPTAMTPPPLSEPTPERLAYIARVAPSKNNPAGFAACAIREAYEVVPPTDRELEEIRLAERAETLRRFHAMPVHDREQIWNEARSRYGEMLEQHNSARYRDIAIARTMKDLGL